MGSEMCIRDRTMRLQLAAAGALIGMLLLSAAPGKVHGENTVVASARGEIQTCSG